MFRKIKRYGWLIGAVFYLSTVFIPFLAPQMVSAQQQGTPVSDMNSPDVVYDGGSGRTELKDPGFITITIVNRNYFQVKVNSNTSLKTNGGDATFDTVFSGIYKDTSLDDDFNYRLDLTLSNKSYSQGTNGAAELDQFNGDAGTIRDMVGVPSNGANEIAKYASIQTSQIQQLLGIGTNGKGIEWTPNVAAKELGIAGCSQNVFMVTNGDKANWLCGDAGYADGYPGVHVDKSVDAATLDRFNIVLRRDGDHLVPIEQNAGDATKYSFTKCNDNKYYLGNNCNAGGDIYIVGSDQQPITNPDTTFGTEQPVPLSLHVNGTFVAITAAGDKDALNQQIANNAAKSTTSDDCLSSDVLGWILCPIIDGLYSALNNLIGGSGQGVSLFTNMLITEPLNKEGDQADRVMYQIWSSFRTIANICFIIVLLAIIFGQATSVVDAYTIKKALPRLAVAVILVQLSFFICGIMIDIFNVLGAGIAGLLLAPVQGLAPFRLDLLGGGSGLEKALFGGAGLLLIKGVRIVAGGAIIHFITIALVSMFVGFLIAFITLIFRKMVIILLIVLSPLAFVCWVLPGTQKIFREWLEWFAKALMMYPLIIALLAAGRLAGAVIVNTGGGGGAASNDTVNSIASLIANFAPFFLIPFTFRFAGKAVGAITGFTNKMQQGIMGDPRNPNSWRNRRLNKARTKDVMRNAQFVRKHTEVDSLGRRKGRSPISGTMARGLARFGPNIDEGEALLQEEAKKRVGQVTGNGDDGWVYALVGYDHNPVTGKPLNLDDVAAAKRHRGNQFMMQAALTYSLNKANTTAKKRNVIQTFEKNGRTAMTTTPTGRRRLYSENQVGAMMIGAAYETQMTHGSLKAVGYMTDEKETNRNMYNKEINAGTNPLFNLPVVRHFAGDMNSPDPKVASQSRDNAAYDVARVGGEGAMNMIEENHASERRSAAQISGQLADFWDDNMAAGVALGDEVMRLDRVASGTGTADDDAFVDRNFGKKGGALDVMMTKDKSLTRNAALRQLHDTRLSALKRHIQYVDETNKTFARQIIPTGSTTGGGPTPGTSAGPGASGDGMFYASPEAKASFNNLYAGSKNLELMINSGLIK